MGTASGLEFELRKTRGDGADCFRVEAPPLTLGSGEILAVTGPSGSGKSTLLEMLGLVLEPEAGSRFDWRIGPGREPLDIVGLWRRGSEEALCELRARRLGFILQSGGLIPFLRVLDNIALPRRLIGLPERGEAVERLIETLGIHHLLGKKPHQLSVGERQRVSIARALAHEPPLLLADEPTAALDPARAETVMRLLVDLVRSGKGMAVIVTHDRELIQRLCLRELRAHLDADGKAARFRDGLREGYGSTGVLPVRDAAKMTLRKEIPFWIPSLQTSSKGEEAVARSSSLALRLGLQDLRHEWRVSSALMLSIVSVLAPLLLLFGLKAGVLDTMRAILLKDPRNLEVIIFENTRLPGEWFERLRAETDRVRFVIPRTRTLNTLVDIENRSNQILKHVEIIPTAAGDPLLPQSLAPPAAMREILLSHAAAAQLGLEPGETLKAWLTRTLDGADQREALELRVAGIVPESSFGRPALFARLELLEALEDYRDGYAVTGLDAAEKQPLEAAKPIVPGPFETSPFGKFVPFQELPGAAFQAGTASSCWPDEDESAWLDQRCLRDFMSPDKIPAARQGQVPESSFGQGKPRSAPRSTYASARLYARRPEDVGPLADRLRASGLETRTRSEDFARLQAADRLLARVLAWIGMIAMVGGSCAFGGAIWITIERKRSTLALLRLIGLRSGDILVFCIHQALLLGVAAFFVSAALYVLGATALNRYGGALFAELLGFGGEETGVLCRLRPEDALLAAAGTLGFTLLASLLGVFHAQSIQPAECLREA